MCGNSVPRSAEKRSFGDVAIVRRSSQSPAFNTNFATAEQALETFSKKAPGVISASLVRDDGTHILTIKGTIGEREDFSVKNCWERLEEEQSKT